MNSHLPGFFTAQRWKFGVVTDCKYVKVLISGNVQVTKWSKLAVSDVLLRTDHRLVSNSDKLVFEETNSLFTRYLEMFHKDTANGF